MLTPSIYFGRWFSAFSPSPHWFGRCRNTTDSSTIWKTLSLKVSEYRKWKFWHWCNLQYSVGLTHPVSKAIYVEIDEKLQKWYKFLDIALVKVLPLSVIVTKSMACFIMYSTTDSVNVFELPIPGRWWAWLKKLIKANKNFHTRSSNFQVSI